MHERLSDEKPFRGLRRVSASDLINEFIEWCEMNGENIALSQARSLIGKVLYRMKVEVQGRSGRGDGKYYEIGSPSDWRRRFALMLGDGTQDIF